MLLKREACCDSQQASLFLYFDKDFPLVHPVSYIP